MKGGAISLDDFYCLDYDSLNISIYGRGEDVTNYFSELFITDLPVIHFLIFNG